MNREKEGIPIQIVGTVSDHVAALLGIVPAADKTIYFGATNLEHMRTSHPDDFARYGEHLVDILAEPDYVGQNPSDGSLEYVKEFVQGDTYVKVAVRLSSSDRYYARSLYVLNPQRVERFIARGTLKKT